MALSNLPSYSCIPARHAEHLDVSAIVISVVLRSPIHITIMAVYPLLHREWNGNIVETHDLCLSSLPNMVLIFNGSYTQSEPRRRVSTRREEIH